VLLTGAAEAAGVLTRLPRARPEPRLAPEAVPQSAAGAVGAPAVAAGASGGVLPDVDVSDMSLFICGLNSRSPRRAGLRGSCRRGARERSTQATRPESRPFVPRGQLLI
jgi:hypothetical protein